MNTQGIFGPNAICLYCGKKLDLWVTFLSPYDGTLCHRQCKGCKVKWVLRVKEPALEFVEEWEGE